MGSPGWAAAPWLWGGEPQSHQPPAGWEQAIRVIWNQPIMSGEGWGDFGTRTWMLRCQCCWYDNQKLLWNGHIWLHLQTLKIQTFLMETDQLKNKLGFLSTPMPPHSKSPRIPKLWRSCQRYETSCRTATKTFIYQHGNKDQKQVRNEVRSWFFLGREDEVKQESWQETDVCNPTLTYFFLFFGGGARGWAYRVLILCPGIEPMPPVWKWGVLTTGSPGKSLFTHV